jgi:hypothetical protein
MPCPAHMACRFFMVSPEAVLLTKRVTFLSFAVGYLLEDLAQKVALVYYFPRDIASS